MFRAVLQTTILAVKFREGVVLGADSRTTTGSYIANRVTDKLTPVVDRILCCRSGSAADTQAVSDIVKYQLRLHESTCEQPPAVETAARLFQSLCYENKHALMAGIIVAGYDAKNGPKVFNVPLGGSLHDEPFSIGGSGSAYIYGYCDANYRDNMSKDECISFVTNCLALAMARDGSSGGVARLAIVTESGVERRCILGNELPRFYAE